MLESISFKFTLNCESETLIIENRLILKLGLCTSYVSGTHRPQKVTALGIESFRTSHLTSEVLNPDADDVLQV